MFTQLIQLPAPPGDDDSICPSSPAGQLQRWWRAWQCEADAGWRAPRVSVRWQPARLGHAGRRVIQGDSHQHVQPRGRLIQHGRRTYTVTTGPATSAQVTRRRSSNRSRSLAGPPQKKGGPGSLDPALLQSLHSVLNGTTNYVFGAGCDSPPAVWSSVAEPASACDRDCRVSRPGEKPGPTV
jgi:hypothetical protein